MPRCAPARRLVRSSLKCELLQAADDFEQLRVFGSKFGCLAVVSEGDVGSFEECIDLSQNKVGGTVVRALLKRLRKFGEAVVDPSCVAVGDTRSVMKLRDIHPLGLGIKTNFQRLSIAFQGK